MAEKEDGCAPLARQRGEGGVPGVPRRFLGAPLPARPVKSQHDGLGAKVPRDGRGFARLGGRFRSQGMIDDRRDPRTGRRGDAKQV